MVLGLHAYLEACIDVVRVLQPHQTSAITTWLVNRGLVRAASSCLRACVQCTCACARVPTHQGRPVCALRENKLRATPSGPDALTFDLLTIWGKIRAGLGAVGLYKDGPPPGARVEQCTTSTRAATR